MGQFPGLIGVPYVQQVLSFGGLSDGKVILSIGIHADVSVSQLTSLYDFCLLPLSVLDGFSGLSEQTRDAIVQKILEGDQEGLYQVIRVNLPLPDDEEIRAVVQKYADWQYSRLTAAYVQTVRACLTFDPESYRIFPGDSFPCESGMWTSAREYRLHRYEFLYDKNSINFAAQASIVSVRLEFVAVSVFTADNLPLSGVPSGLSRVYLGGGVYAFHDQHEEEIIEFSVGNWTRHRYAGNTWLFPIGVNPRFFYVMTGLESDDRDIWAYHYPPVDVPGLDGSYHVTDTIFPYVVGETFAPIGVLINENQATMPWGCYVNDIYSAYEGSTWVVAHTLKYRCLVAGFSCEFRPGMCLALGRRVFLRCFLCCPKF